MKKLSFCENWTFHGKPVTLPRDAMIACCNDGTRPVIFKIERIDD